MPSRARLDRSRHGTLAIRFHWQGPVWEGLGVPDTPENRAHFQPICDRISEELDRGAFDARRYLAYFPRGNRAARYQTAEQPAAPAPFLSDWSQTYLERQRLEGSRLATRTAYASFFRSIEGLRLDDGATVGNLRLDEITPARVLEIRTALLRGRKRSSVKTMINGGFRAAMNEARHLGLISTDPFAGLPRLRGAKETAPDPYTGEERDQILAWFATERPAVWDFVLTLFHAGLRPSEATGRRLADFDLRTGKLRIDSSRTMGEDNAPKHAGANRTIALVPVVRDALAARYPLHPDGNAFLFTQPGTNLPIEQTQFARSDWAACVRALKLRPRRRALYACRHTFLSIGVSLGRNFLWLASYCGTSPRMIEEHYARYLPDVGGDQLGALATEAEKSRLPAAQGAEKKQRER